MGQTFQMLAEKIQTTYERGIAEEDAVFSLPHIAQLAAEEIAAIATQNALENSKSGETTYSNDQFITTYTNIALTFSSALQSWLIAIPSQFSAIPGTSGVTIIPYGARKVQIVMMKNKDRFAQSMLDPIPGVILAYMENNQILFDGSTAYMPTAVNLKLVGGLPGGTLMTALTNLPKSYEPIVSEKVIQRLIATAQRKRDDVEIKQGGGFQ